MAGLDTRGLASGFSQGFGLMNQYQQQQNQSERADQRMGMQQERMDMQRKQFDAQQEEVGRARDMEDLQFTLGKIGSGMDVSDDEMELLRKYPKFQAALDPDTDASIEQAQSVIDPESPVDGNDPESLAALNQMFGAEINKGDGGSKRVVGMVPGPDGESVMLELEMEGEDGKPYRAPMTKGRSNSEDDDLVMSVPVEKLVEQTQGMRMLRNTFQSPEAQASATKVLNILRGESPEKWEQVQGPDGSIFQRNARTGEMKSLIGRKSSSSSGSYYNRPTATMKEARWLVDNGVATDIKSAFETLQQRQGDNSYSRSEDRIDALRNRAEDLEKVIKGESATIPTEDELAQAKQELGDVRQMLQESENSTYGISMPGQGQAPQEAPPSKAPAPEPRKSPSAKKESGPSPKPSTQKNADDILNKFF